MTKRTIEIEDNLDDTVDDLKEEIKRWVIDYLKENPDMTEWDDLYQAIDYNGWLHETVDSATPIYTKEINDLYYLYGDDFEEAYKNAGIGNGDEDNHRQAAIYCYLSEKAYDYLNELQEAFEEWITERDVVMPESPIEDGSIAVESTIKDFIKLLEE